MDKNDPEFDPDISLWAEADGPIMLKAVTGIGSDPVELTSEEARRLASRLLELADTLD